MFIWSIQSLAAWEQASTAGILRANAAYIEPYFQPAYRWLAVELARRCGPPPAGVEFPVWAWRDRPDLRAGGYLPAGSQGVRLACQVPSNTVLLSDFDRWHFVLNDCYLPADPDDDAEWLLPRTDAEKQASWQRIFAVVDGQPTQAVLWQIPVRQVRAVQHFRAR